MKTQTLIKVDYDDGDQEVLNLRNEIWRSQATGIFSNEIQLARGAELTSIEKDAIKMYFEKFQHKQFMLHHAQALPSFVTQNAYIT